MNDKHKPVGLESNEHFAEEYGALADTKPHNAYIERPTTLSLLPNVSDKDIVDVGCGPGIYTEILLNQGARVVAFDVTPRMVELARARIGDRADVHLANLEEPLDFLSDESQDVIISPLVLDYIEDWLPVMKEFYRILRRGGVLIFSVNHPFVIYEWLQPDDYFQTELFEMTWRGFGKPVVVKSYWRPFTAMFEPLTTAGFSTDRVLESRPIEALRRIDPEEYEHTSKKPTFLCIRAVKPK